VRGLVGRMKEWDEGVSRWRADRIKSGFKKKHGRNLGSSGKSSHLSRMHKMSARYSRSKKQRLHRVSPKMQREWAEGVSQWVMQREVVRSNHYFLKKFGIIKGNSSEEWKEGMQVWLDQGLLNKSWKWRASKGKFMPSKNRRRIKRLKSVISGENRLRHKTDDPNKRRQTSYVSANSKAIPVPAVSFTNESEQSKDTEEIESLEKDKEENIKKGEESSNDLELLEKQMKPRKNSKLFTLGICSLVGAIVCLVYGLGYSKISNLIEKSENKQLSIQKKQKHNIELNSSVRLEMIWVEPGTFMMGSPVGETGRSANETEHNVTLTKGFYLGKHEVTQAQWERVMGGNPSYFKGADRPVDQVSWNDAVEFCNKLTEMEKKAGRVPEGMSYQLPTEAQWEYACRAGTSTMYSWGDSISSSNANYDRNVGETTPVGKYPVNPWGFYDMHGNIYEWCADWYGTYPSGSVTDPEGPASGSFRVIRGGSWYSDGTTLRSAERGNYAPSGRYDSLGFRVGFLSSK